MRLKTLTIGLLIGLMAGCSGNNQNTIVTSTLKSQQASKSRVTEPNEFDSVSFPQESCGEKLPNDPKAYPVKYYPVFIDYSEGNLQSVKSKYCRDALKKFRKTIGKDAIQVASFLSIERANKFQKFMSEKLGSGEVGEPTVIEAKRTTEGTDSPAQSKLPVGEAAKLTREQAKQLILIDNVKAHEGITFKVILPTYIPPGFKVDKFEIRNDGYSTTYTIIYLNSTNSCFSIFGSDGAWGDAPSDNDTVEVSSPALGKVVLAYTGFDRDRNTGSIGFPGDRVQKEGMGYAFSSPAWDTDSCNSISLQEAIKTVESLEYLNP